MHRHVFAANIDMDTGGPRKKNISKDSLPSFLFPKKLTYDADEPFRGLFKGELLLKVSTRAFSCVMADWRAHGRCTGPS